MPHPTKGMPGKPHTAETKSRLSASLRKYYAEHPPSDYTEEDRIRLNREAVHRSRAKKNRLLPSDADIDLIKQFYLNTPDGYEVDHVKPFAVGGFHHQDNLQYLTVEDNRKKGTTYIGM